MAARRLVVGNWKMNGLFADAQAIIGTLVDRMGGEPANDPSVDLVVCPPSTLVMAVADLRHGTRIGLGGQDCHAKEKGAFTGEISAAMLKDAGCGYVIVGHSERRTLMGEDDAAVRAKAAAAQEAGLTPIICVGETEAERDANETLNVIESQLLGSLPIQAVAGNTIVAYEPVWAIGTGRTPTVDQVAEVHDFMRKWLVERLETGADVPLLYGGSVKPGNAAELMAVRNVDGALVGGASLVADDFWSIYKAAV